MCIRTVQYALSASAALFVGASGVGGQAAAQGSSCTYARCALRIEATPGDPFVTRLVQGIDARPVTDRGVLIPTIPLFEPTPDSVRQPYESYRVHAAATRALIGASLVAGIVSGAMLASPSTSHASRLVPAFGIELGLISASFIETARAGKALETAITRYNSALPERH